MFQKTEEKKLATLQGEIKNDTLDFVSNLKEPIIKIISPSRKTKILLIYVHPKLKMLYREIITIFG